MAVTQFVLEVTAFDDELSWHWVLRDERGAFLADHSVALDSLSPEVEGVRDLNRYLRLNSDYDRPEKLEELLTSFGKWLDPQVFGEISLHIRRGAPACVQVKIPQSAEVLLSYPFETAIRADLNLPLDGVTLSYSVVEDPKKPIKAKSDKVRVLALFSLPLAEDPLNLRAERQGLRRLVRQLTGNGVAQVDLRTLQYGLTREALRDVLQEGEGWDVVHFSGHGLPGMIALENPDGSADLVTADTLVSLLSETARHLKLVTISACHSGAAQVDATLKSLGIQIEPDLSPKPPHKPECGQALSRIVGNRLDCSVVAMRFPVEDRFAILFAENLYRQMFGKQATVAEAVQRSIKASAGSCGCASLSAATPATFGRDATELRFNIRPPAKSSFALPLTGLFRFPSEPDRFVGRVGTMTRASAALAVDGNKAGVLFHGMVGGGKSACAIELAHHFQQLSRFTGWVWFKAPDLGQPIGTTLADFALAMESQLPDFKMLDVIANPDLLTNWLPKFQDMLKHSGILIVVDNIESMLTPQGHWRDPHFGSVISAAMSHGGLSRVVLTSRVLPNGLPSTMHVEVIHALSAREAALLMSEPPRLFRLCNGTVDERSLARRVFNVVQGHPKLLELAEGLAEIPELLARQVQRSEDAQARDESPVEAFLIGGRSDLSAESFVQTLHDWTDLAISTLPSPAATLFKFLCSLEESDRSGWVVEATWRLFVDGTGEAVTLFSEAFTFLAALALVEHTGIDQAERYEMHPSVRVRGLKIVEPALRRSVDKVMSGFWIAIYADGRERELEGRGHWVTRGGLAAVPYLVRLEEFAAAGDVLEQVMVRDSSRSTIALVLPQFDGIVEGTKDTEEALFIRAKRGEALRLAGRNREAEGEFREIIDGAVAIGRFRLASPIAGLLVNLLIEESRLDEAQQVVTAKQVYTEKADLGPWTRLLDEGKILGILLSQGHSQKVLDRVLDLTTVIDNLPAPVDEAAIPWNVCETLYDLGRHAADDLRQWDLALRLSSLVQESQRVRGAHPRDLAHSRLRDYRPLLNLYEADAVENMLTEVRSVFEEYGDLGGLSNVLSAMAAWAERAQTVQAAAKFERRALHYAYLTPRLGARIISHFNLANYLFAQHDRRTATAHRLASAILCMALGQVADDSFNALMVQWEESGLDIDTYLPPSFIDLVADVEKDAEVPFGETVYAITGTRDLTDLMPAIRQKLIEWREFLTKSRT